MPRRKVRNPCKGKDMRVLGAVWRVRKREGMFEIGRPYLAWIGVHGFPPSRQKEVAKTGTEGGFGNGGGGLWFPAFATERSREDGARKVGWCTEVGARRVFGWRRTQTASSSGWPFALRFSKAGRLHYEMPPGSVTASFGEPPWFPLWFVFTNFLSGPAWDNTSSTTGASPASVIANFSAAP